jgi:predicted dehydrogenase
MSGEGILLVGCGKQAEKHIAGFQAAGLTDIILNDIDPKLAASLAERKGLRWVETIDEALSDPKIAAVDVCAPTPFHYPLLTAAFNAGKHAFCEKPLCETVEQGRELARLANEKNRKCALGFIYRFAPAFERLKGLLVDEERADRRVLGRTIHATLKVGGRGSHAQWKHRLADGGGAINEMLVHMLDLAMFLFGTDGDAKLLHKALLQPVRTINGKQMIADAEDYVVAQARFGGVEILLEADLVTPVFFQQVIVQGENGTFTGSIQDRQPSSLYLMQSRGEYPAGATEFAFGEMDLFVKQMTDFARVLRERDYMPRSSITNGVRLLELIEKIRQA